MPTPINSPKTSPKTSAKPARPVARTITVRATRLAFYKDRRVVEGEEFEIPADEDLYPWMEEVTAAPARPATEGDDKNPGGGNAGKGDGDVI